MAASVAILMLVTAACSGDPVAGYFTEVETAIAAMRRDSLAATPRGAAVTRDGVAEVNEARRAAVTTLEGVEVPDPVRPEHMALLGALRDMVKATDALLASLSNADSAAFEAAVTQAGDLAATAQRVGLACTALDRRASALGVDVDIRC